MKNYWIKLSSDDKGKLVELSESMLALISNGEFVMTNRVQADGTLMPYGFASDKLIEISEAKQQ